jgi:hypothetical protein
MEMLSKNEMDIFDESIRSALAARQEELKLSDDALGRMAFGFLGKPLGKVRSILIAQGSGDYKKPQNIRTADLVNFCEALGLPWTKVIKDALEAVRAARKESPS